MYGLSVKYPLQRSESDGYYRLTKNYEEMLTQNLRNLLLTNPGERVMDPDFGVGVRELLFEPDHEVVKGTLHSRIKTQIQRYMPMLTLQKVQIYNPEGEAGSPRGEVVYVEVRALIDPIGKEILVPIEVEDFV